MAWYARVVKARLSGELTGEALIGGSRFAHLLLSPDGSLYEGSATLICPNGPTMEPSTPGRSQHSRYRHSRRGWTDGYTERHVTAWRAKGHWVCRHGVFFLHHWDRCPCMQADIWNPSWAPTWQDARWMPAIDREMRAVVVQPFALTDYRRIGQIRGELARLEASPLNLEKDRFLMTTE